MRQMQPGGNKAMSFGKAGRASFHAAEEESLSRRWPA